ncbi:hypothetical protein O3G_MSEX005078 [Manduca sexta]|uniref:Uncharacterized protein n=1 Tax=Manduca sexta TaxID=7130 RepID=A0A921YYR8_MANSE|nr:hypothetical protein O3G_MSEX005078 [Manduca sexta]
MKLPTATLKLSSDSDAPRFPYQRSLAHPPASDSTGKLLHKYSY